MRFPMGDVVGSNQYFGNRQSTVLQAVSSQQPRTRSDYSPLPPRNRSQQIYSTRHDRNSTLIVRLMIFNRVGFGLSIEMWRDAPDHFNRANAVRDGHNRIAVDALAGGPFAPLAVHCARRVNKNSVQVKKNG